MSSNIRVDINRHMAQGLRFQEAGDMKSAIGFFSMALKLDPRDPDILHILGAALAQSGDLERGEQLVKASLGLQPANGSSWASLMRILAASRRNSEALIAAEKVVENQPDHVEAQAVQAEILPKVERPRAERHARRAALLAPETGLGVRRLAELLRYRSDDNGAHRCYRWMVVVLPGVAEGWAGLASMLMTLKEDWPGGKAKLRKAAILRSELHSTFDQLGYISTMELEMAEARKYFARSLCLKPRGGSALSGLAEVAYASGELSAAVDWSRQAIEAEPSNAQTRFRYGIHLLAAGDLKQGWTEHEFLWRKPGAIERIGAPPRWEGEDLSGKGLLVCADQGIGDELLFSSIFKDAAAVADQLVIECDKRLVSLFQRSFPSAYIHAFERQGSARAPQHHYGWLKDAPAVHAHIEGGGLARHFRNSVEALDQADGAWLLPDQARVAEFESWLNGLGEGLKIGLSWRSKRLGAHRNAHYPGLEMLAPLFAVPGTRFISLQYGEGWEQEIKAAGVPIQIAEGLDTTNDMEGVFALCEALDLIICPSSTLGWVGAALAKPTWLLYNSPVFLEFGTERYPGFSTVKPLAKRQIDPWEPLVQSVGEALRELTSSGA